MIQNMTEAALAARENAYAPYSGFFVGAALRGESGRIYTGCNVENASYSMGICAERSAVFQALASGEKRFRTLAVSGGRTNEDAKLIPCVPCGACLQVLSEFCSPDFPILLADGVHKLSDFLPVQFNLSSLSQFGCHRDER
ncbi:MAG: cytidine deaminase [Ruminococcus sp.]|nr:cytidine deaminase [Ruminococcus sp.]